MGDSLQDLIDKVVQWGKDRNLNAPENLNAQAMKLVSEFGEIGMGLCQNADFEVTDGIGDTLVVAIIIGQQIGFPINSHEIQWSGKIADVLEYQRASGRLGLFVDAVLKKHPNKELRELLIEFVVSVCDFAEDFPASPEACLEAAYEEIKDRKGVMYNGAFIKESDSRYEAVMSNLRMAKQAGAA
jgi:hypothetical protein